MYTEMYPCNRPSVCVCVRVCSSAFVQSAPAEEEEGEESGSVDEGEEEDAAEGEEEEEDEEESSEDEAALEDVVEGEQSRLGGGGRRGGGGTLCQTPTATILAWRLPSLQHIVSSPLAHAITMQLCTALQLHTFP